MGDWWSLFSLLVHEERMLQAAKGIKLQSLCSNPYFYILCFFGVWYQLVGVMSFSWILYMTYFVVDSASSISEVDPVYSGYTRLMLPFSSG